MDSPSTQQRSSGFHASDDNGVWFYRFIETGIVPLGPLRKTRNPDVIRGIVERGGGITDSEAQCMLDFGIEKQGQGGLYLTLTDEQYQKLKK